MKNSCKKLCRELIVLAALAVGIGAGIWIDSAFLQKEVAEPLKPTSEAFDLKLPTETEKRIVTREEVEAKLVEVQEFAAYSGQYHVLKAEELTRYILEDIEIPGTRNKIALECDGIAKVGYDVEEITVSVEPDADKIFIKLPQAKVLDNYLIWDTMVCEEHNNILHPIEFARYQELVGELEEMGLAEAEKEGIYKAAEKNMKTVVRNFLGEFDEYEVVFM